MKLVIICAPCQLAGKRRKLAQFNRLPSGLSAMDAGTVRGQWLQAGPQQWASSTGEGGGQKIHLRCGCGHTPQIGRSRIDAELAAAQGTVYIAL